MTGSAFPRGQAVHLPGAVGAESGVGPPVDDSGSDPIPAGTGNVAGSTTSDGTGTGSGSFPDERVSVGPAMLIVTLWGATEDPNEVDVRHRQSARD